MASAERVGNRMDYSTVPVAGAAEERSVTSAHPPRTGLDDLLRELVHELRTPLNAISGFAQLIAAQACQTPAMAYRSSALRIVAEAAKLAALIDSLETGAEDDILASADAPRGKPACQVPPCSVSPSSQVGL